MESLLAQNRVKLVLLTPDFQNPTGTTIPVAERRKLLEIIARYQMPVVEDRIYARLRVRGNAVPSLKALDRHGLVIQIDSFSKVAFPGLRVGWCVGPENVIERLRIVKQTTDLHTDQLAQATLAEFVRRGKSGPALDENAQGVSLAARSAGEGAGTLHAGRDYLDARRRRHVVVGDIAAGFDAGELLIHVREKGVLFVPGRYFYFQNPQLNTLRLGFASLDERKIARGIQTLGALVESELEKKQRGARRFESGRVALV